MRENVIIEIKLDPINEEQSILILQDIVQIISCSVKINIGNSYFSVRGEPILNFLREYYTALVNSVLFDIPSTCSMFSDDIAINFAKVTHDSDIMLVEARVADRTLGSAGVTKKALIDVFKDGASQILDALRPRFSFAEIAETLSSPMIPMNEGYAPTFFGGVRPEGSERL